jgi:hypothetical protein
MIKIKIYHRESVVGTIPVPDSFRPPIDPGWLRMLPASMIATSISWLLELRRGDLCLELRGEGSAEEVVVIATPRLCPGDFGRGGADGVCARRPRPYPVQAAGVRPVGDRDDGRPGQASW